MLIWSFQFLEKEVVFRIKNFPKSERLEVHTKVFVFAKKFMKLSTFQQKPAVVQNTGKEVAVTETKTKAHVSNDEDEVPSWLVPKKIILDNKILSPLPPNILRVGDKIFLDKFNFDSIEPTHEGLRLGFVGQSGSGKTTLLKNKILSNPNIARIPYWVIVNGSEKTNKAYAPFMYNPSFIQDDPKMANCAIKNFQKRQELACDQWELDATCYPKTYYKDPRGGIIIDDCSADQKIFNDECWGWLYQNSRNCQAFCVHLVQYQKTLCPKYRRQLSHLFLYRVPSPHELEELYKEFGGKFGAGKEGKEAFMLAHDIATADGKMLIIVIDVKKSKIEESIFWADLAFKQTTPYPKIGSKWFHKIQKEYYNPDWKTNEATSGYYEPAIPEVKKGKKGKKDVILLNV